MNQTFDFYNARFVNGDRVIQAREMACMTQVELARSVGVTQPMIAHLEKGLKQPSMDLLMHQPPTAKAKAEGDANAFAAELHMPAEAIRSDLEYPLSVERLGQLKLKWGVSMASLLFRAKELGLISRRSHERLIVEMVPYRMHEPEAYSVPLEKPRALRQMVESLYGEQIDCKVLADEFCLPTAFVREVLDRYASSMDIAPTRLSKVVNIGSRLHAVLSANTRWHTGWRSDVVASIRHDVINLRRLAIINNHSNLVLLNEDNQSVSRAFGKTAFLATARS